MNQRSFHATNERFTPEQLGVPKPESVETANLRFGKARETYKIATAMGVMDNLSDSSLGRLLGQPPKTATEAALAGIIKDQVMPDVGRNRVGLFRTQEKMPNSDEAVYFDATVVSLDQFGNVSEVGELIGEGEMNRRLQERATTQDHTPLTTDGEQIDRPLPVTVTQQGTEQRQDLMAFDPANNQYVLPAAA